MEQLCFGTEASDSGSLLVLMTLAAENGVAKPTIEHLSKTPMRLFFSRLPRNSSPNCVPEQYFFLLHINAEMASATLTDVGPTKNTGTRFHEENAMSSIVPLVAGFLGTNTEVDGGVLGSAQSSITWVSLLRKWKNLENCYF